MQRILECIRFVFPISETDIQRGEDRKKDQENEDSDRWTQTARSHRIRRFLRAAEDVPFV